MANKTIAQLTGVSTPLTGSEIVPAMQGGVTKKVTVQSIADLAAGGGNTLGPISIIADGTVTTYPQGITYKTGGVLGTQSGNQTITVITYPEIYIAAGSTSTTITLSGIPVASVMAGNSTNLVSIAFPDLTYAPGGGMMSLAVTGCSSLTTISIPALTTADSTSYSFNNNALSEATVDHILAKFAAATGVNGTLYINGGTNATPSAAGLASKATLVGRGWTVNHN